MRASSKLKENDLLHFWNWHDEETNYNSKNFGHHCVIAAGKTFKIFEEKREHQKTHKIFELQLFLNYDLIDILNLVLRLHSGISIA